MAGEVSLKLPLVTELLPPPDPETAFRQLVQYPHCIFLDSALRHKELGRFSFIACDPFAFVHVPADGSDALGILKEPLERYASISLPELPPFQGGIAGLFSYDLNRSLEETPTARFDEFTVPALAVGVYDVVLGFDHQQERAWIVSQGWPEEDPAKRVARATERMQELRRRLVSPQDSQSESRAGDSAPAVPRHELAPQFPTETHHEVSSNFTKQSYLDAVSRAIEYIRAGDAFQVNLSQRLLSPASTDSKSLYLRLRQRNPATFAAYFDLGDFQIASASPERFVRVRQRQVEARPIKGTRQRTALPEADFFAAEDLRQSEKDRAENVMIVDLLRNDLSRVCQPASVQVTQLCDLEVYEYVQHLVSAICGELAADKTSLDLLRASFPGGSITGAPKVRAMEIIAELEPTARGAYCGSLGYVGFDGSMDLSILIRTITAGRGWWQFPVGGGIVAQSNPQHEYEETWHKAQGLLRALRE
jgi:para-aminobenzoate synthetase component 1